MELQKDFRELLEYVTWKRIATHRVAGKYGNTKVYFIGKEELIINKKSIGRHKDLADLESISGP